ncbi:MAG: hypothetical protein V3574_04270 [Candidatus Moraniibacteriota bacterium]
MEKETALVGDSVETPQNDNPSVAPTDQSPSNDEPKEKEAEKIKEDIDPRIVEIVGEDNIQKVYESPDGNIDEEEKSEPEEKKTGEDREANQENAPDNKNDFLQNQNNYRPSRLDRRLANRFVRVLTLQGEENVPSEEQILSDLKSYSKDDKISALMHYLSLEKQLRGQTPDNVLEEEDNEAIKDAEREEIRREIIQEEQTVREAENFVDFMEKHPELDENTKDYDPTLADAVETLFRGGMPINKAFQTVMSKIEKVKEEKIANEKKEKSRALSGILSGSGESTTIKDDMSWEEVQTLSEENPQLYRKMLAEGKFKNLI